MSLKNIITFSPIKELSGEEKAAKRARKASAQQSKIAEERGEEEAKAIAEGARERKLTRREDIARTKTLVSDPLGLGGKADVIRKTLTGQ